MKRTLPTALGGIVGLLVLGVGGVWAGGAMLPREHTASASADIAAPVDEVWRVVRDYDRLHQWAPDIVALQRIEPPGPLPAYRMQTDGEVLIFSFVEESAPNRLVVDLSTESEVFGGRWTYELQTTELGTELTITEDGWVDPPPFRLIMTLTGGYDDTVTTHVEALKAHLEG